MDGAGYKNESPLSKGSDGSTLKTAFCWPTKKITYNRDSNLLPTVAILLSRYRLHRPTTELCTKLLLLFDQLSYRVTSGGLLPLSDILIQRAGGPFKTKSYWVAAVAPPQHVSNQLACVRREKEPKQHRPGIEPGTFRSISFRLHNCMQYVQPVRLAFGQLASHC